MRDSPLRASMAMEGRVPEFAIVMHVERVLIHCPKCVLRAKLWQPEAWPDSSNTAGIAADMVAHAKLTMTPDELEALAQREGADEAVLRTRRRLRWA